MLLPLTRRLFSSSHRGLVVVKKISDKKNCKTETQLMLLTLTKRFIVAMAIYYCKYFINKKKVAKWKISHSYLH